MEKRNMINITYEFVKFEEIENDFSVQMSMVND